MFDDSRALQYLVRSVRAADTFPQAVDAVKTTVYALQSPSRLRRAGMSFGHWMVC